MHLTFEEFDFCGENAARTTRIMRAIADAADPSSAQAPVTIRNTLGDASVSVTAATVAQALDAMHAKAGTVATHVSAAAVGDVPFAEQAAPLCAQGLVRPAAEQLIGTPELRAIAAAVKVPVDILTGQAAAATVADMAPPAALGVDAEGYPWDERIHSSSRNTVADGTWRKKRGVDDALVAQVRAEWDAKLRGAAPAPTEAERCSMCGEPQFETPSGVSCPNGHGGAPAAPTEAERLQADHVVTMPIDPATVGFGAAPAQVPPPPPAAPAASDAWPDEILGPRTDAMAPFPQFLTWANRQISAGALDNARLLAVLGEHGVPIITGLAAPEHVGKIPAIARQLAGA